MFVFCVSHECDKFPVCGVAADMKNPAYTMIHDQSISASPFHQHCAKSSYSQFRPRQVNGDQEKTD